jgi:hypothetical protein
MENGQCYKPPPFHPTKIFTLANALFAQTGHALFLYENRLWKRETIRFFVNPLSLSLSSSQQR